MDQERCNQSDGSLTCKSGSNRKACFFLGHHISGFSLVLSSVVKMELCNVVRAITFFSDICPTVKLSH